MSLSVPEKANKVLSCILLAFLLIAVRVWYLTVIQHDAFVEVARRPQHRTVVKKAKRGTIRDRFGAPLAINQVSYSVAVLYDEIRHIPATSWVKKKKISPRKEYIEALSKVLAKELAMSPVDIEDAIYARAAIFPNTPYILRDGVEEEVFFRLKGLERLWPGVVAQVGSKRHYPNGPLAGHLLGYVGAIDQKGYHKIAHELSVLRKYLSELEAGKPVFLPSSYRSPSEVYARVKALEEMSVKRDDTVGRTGVERSFEAELRGQSGKVEYMVDTRGRPVKKLEGEVATIPGSRLQLAISKELQEHAEKLLAENEAVREGRFSTKVVTPWVKGGAIVAMVPQTGEVVAFASHPRFDPNDFAMRGGSIAKWLETERYIGAIWDGKRPFEREAFSFVAGKYVSEQVPLTWERFLERVVSPGGKVRQALERVKTVGRAARIVERYQKTGMAEFGEIKDPHDALLMLDLLRVATGDQVVFPEALGKLSLGKYHEVKQAFAKVIERVEVGARELFHHTDFLTWREKHFAKFLREKREWEKEKKTYQRPYTLYLERCEKEEFAKFWEKARPPLLEHILYGKEIDEDLEKYALYLDLSQCTAAVKILQEALDGAPLESLTRFSDLSAPLARKYRNLRGKNLKDLAMAFYPRDGFGYMKSFGHSEATPLGSIFKVVAAYGALKEHYTKGDRPPENLNPLTIIDEHDPYNVKNQNSVLGYTLDGKKITRRYKGGRLPKSSSSRLGKVDFMTAMERSSNVYYSLLASEVIKKPEHLIKTCEELGIGKKTGIALPGEYAGILPRDVCRDKSALYSFAIGQHRLITTPVQTAILLGSFATGGHLVKPQVAHKVTGHKKQYEMQANFPLKEKLARIGIGFPLFRTDESCERKKVSRSAKKEVLNEVFLPHPMRDYLLTSLKTVFDGAKGTARPATIQYLAGNKRARDAYMRMKRDFAGKTSTAEVAYKPYLDREGKSALCNHIWCGGISFRPPQSPLADPFQHPELVVVVYLQYGKFGKEAAPIALEIADKWRSITTLREK